MLPRDHCSPSLALPTMCLQGPPVTASSDELCTAKSSHLKGLSHKQQRPSKTREPDFPDGHPICGRQPLTILFPRRTLYGLKSASVGKSNITDIYTSLLVWNDLHVAPAWAAETRLPPAGMLFPTSCCKATVWLCLNLARLQTKTYHSFWDVSRPLLNNFSLHSFH